jgi:alkylation response protein AidB-like acyl-CoA dehydrogenase
MHGGWGVIANHPIARAYVDARVTRIYGGSNEVLREVVARTLAPGS